MYTTKRFPVSGRPCLRTGNAPSARPEKSHKERYRALLKNVESKTVFEKSGVTIWECRNYCHLVVGTNFPKVCPVFKHPQSQLELRKGNF